MSCRFSIIIPVYNVEAYLERCVQSALRQTFDSYEVLLVDDGSTDGSGNLCDQLAQGQEKLCVYHKENGGLSSARNFGMDRARGEYLIFVDSDDYISEEMCQVLDSALRKQSAVIDLVAFDGIEINGKEKCPVRRLPLETERLDTGHGYLIKNWKQRNMVNVAWAYAYRRAFVNEKNLRFIDGILHEDVEILPRVLLEARQVLSIPNALYCYEVREDSISTQKNKEKNIKDLFTTLESQAELARQQEPELRKWMLNAVLNSYLNMVQEARMYEPRYRKFLKKRFLLGKSATAWNHFRAALCFLNVRWYCVLNDWYKNRRGQED